MIPVRARFAKTMALGAAFLCQVPAKPSVIPEFSSVRALAEIREGRDVIPVGATGTVVDVVKGGAGYFVEFTKPVHAVVAVRKDQMSIA